MRNRFKPQRRLARCGQLDKDSGQQLGIEQCAVSRAAGAINAITRA
jgi:hypothetical protein